MKNVNKFFYYLLMIVVAGIATVYILDEIAIHPGSIILEIGGDSMKNYYTFIQHALYGEGFNFSGMNYPYGENIIYADGQPLLSILLQKVGIASYQDALAILHLAMAAGLFLCIVYCYKIFRFYNIHPIFAIIAACIIPMTSPQLIRLLGHFGLSYMCVVPMLFYWSIKYFASNRNWYVLLMLISGCAFSLLHPYLAALVLVWILFYIVAYMLSVRSTIKNKLIHILPMLAIALMIVLFVKGVISYTDPIKDRSTYPYGIFSGGATILSLFTANWSPIWTSILGNNYSGSITEGSGYPGIAVWVLILIATFTIIIRLRKKQKPLVLTADVGFKPIWLFIALFALIMSTGVPMIWVKSSIDYLSVLRQFRTIGRFVWIFYYIATIYTVILIYSMYLKAKANGKTVKAFSILILPMLLWFFEAKPHVDFLHDKQIVADHNFNFIFNQSKKTPDWTQFLKENGYTPDAFQAVTGLPYFHIGSEKLWILKNNAWMCTLAIQAASQTGLPIMGVQMSRSSWSQTFEQVKILSGLYADKTILGKLPNDKPILLLNTSYVELGADERLLLDIADSIGMYQKDLIVYALYPKRLKYVCDSALNNALQIANSTASKDTCIGCNDNSYVIEHFEDIHSDFSLAGLGAFPENRQHKNEIIRSYKLKPSSDTVAKEYEFSYWTKVSNIDYRSPEIKLDFKDSAGNHITTVVILTKFSTDNAKDIWLRGSDFFELPVNAARMNFYLGEYEKENYIAIDELQLRPADALIISKVQQKGDTVAIMANNHLLGYK